MCHDTQWRHTSVRSGVYGKTEGSLTMFELLFIAFALTSAMGFAIYGLLFASAPVKH
jgi:hypothetical protein